MPNCACASHAIISLAAIQTEILGVSIHVPWMARRAVVRSSLLSPPSYYEAVHDGRGPTSPEYPFLGGWYHYMDQEPHSYKRRGGVVDHRDIIMAHQAHKIHNTPQAQRKEWE
uniref:Uncharacterized protein n=1 Tax=Sphaerodactylus townsendi TaxID=933632 RepID=A0ACB8EJA8_9SAUR